MIWFAEDGKVSACEHMRIVREGAASWRAYPAQPPAARYGDQSRSFATLADAKAWAEQRIRERKDRNAP